MLFDILSYFITHRSRENFALDYLMIIFVNNKYAGGEEGAKWAPLLVIIIIITSDYWIIQNK